MKQLLKEEFDIEVKDGVFYDKIAKSKYKCFTIKTSNDDDSYKIKDYLKSNFGAKFNGYEKAWELRYYENSGISINDFYNNTVVPCYKWLVQHENGNYDGSNINQIEQPRDIQAKLDAITKAIDEATTSLNTKEAHEIIANIDDVKNSLERFKSEILLAANMEEFQKKLEPIVLIQKRSSIGGGVPLSFPNSILIFVQDPEATMVKNESVWAEYWHRSVNEGAPKLFVSIPIGKQSYFSKDKKEKILKKYIIAAKKIFPNDVFEKEEDLPGDFREKYNREIKSVIIPKSFKFVACQYDVRFTTQIEGKSDELSKIGTGVGKNEYNISWYDDDKVEDYSPEEQKKQALIFDATIAAITELGIKVSYVPRIGVGNARGVSKSGVINILSDAPKTIGTCATLFHEFAHEILHQRFLKDSNTEIGQYMLSKQNRNMEEQEAEMTAWVVLRFFDYKKINTDNLKDNAHLNYMRSWGMNNPAGVTYIFDLISNAASTIYRRVKAKMDEMSRIQQESVSGEIIFTGLDVAKMFGMEDIYKAGVKSNPTVQTVTEMFRRINNI